VATAARAVIVAGLAATALLVGAAAASAAPPAPQPATPPPQELNFACSSALVALAPPNAAGRCAPGQSQVSLLPGPTSLCVVPDLGFIYLSSVTGRCTPFAAVTVPLATADVYFCRGLFNLLALSRTPKCGPGEPVYALTKPPQAVNDVASVSYGAPTATGNVLTNDLYVSLNPVTVTALTSSGTVKSTPTGFKASLADGSTLTVSSAGAYSFTASAAFFATCSATAADTFGYTITNAYGQASSASLTVTLTCPPLPQSQAVNDADSLTYDATGISTVTGNLLANDKNLAADPSTITAVSGVTPSSGVITKAGTYGTLVVDTTGPSAGNYTYAPSGLPTTCGTLTDNFTYTLIDGYGRASSASLTITLSCDEEAPIALSGTADVSSASPIAIGNLLTSVVVPTDDRVSLIKVSAGGGPQVGVSGMTTVDLTDGVLTVAANGAYSYTANSSFFTSCLGGAAESATYTVSDEFGQTASANLTFILACPPAQSQAVDDDGSLTYDAGGASAATGNLLANDKGLATDPSTITAVNSVTPVSGVITKSGTYGTLVVQTTGPSAGSYTYTPSGLPATCGTLTDNFTYTLTDGYGRASSASLTITLSCDQAAPTALSVSAALSSSSPTATGNIISGVDVPDGDTVSLTSVKFGSSTLSLFPANLVLPDGTSVAVGAAGNYTVTAEAAFFTTCSGDSTDLGTYTVTDEFGQTATANLTFALACPPPVSITTEDDLGGTFSSATNNTTGGEAIPGSAITYTVVVSNVSAEAQNAVVSDILPADFTSDVWSSAKTNGAAATLSGGMGNIDDAVSLPATSSITFTIVGTVNSSATGSLSNTVTATDSPTSVSSTDTATLRPFASLAIVNTDNLGDLIPGEPITYMIVVSNLGPSDATNVTVVDGTRLIAVTSPDLPATVIFNASTQVWTVGTLATGAEVTLQLHGTVPLDAAGSFSSTATANAPDAITVSSTQTNIVGGA
jgi:uncharacterized repeat protein (TIGR01451 family)